MSPYSNQSSSSDKKTAAVKPRYVRDTCVHSFISPASPSLVVHQDSEDTPESFREGEQRKRQTRQGPVISNQLEMQNTAR